MGKIEIYTDGSCYPNPGYGSWAVAVICDDKLFYKTSQVEEGASTNNICEIKAILQALYISKEMECRITIISDSQYAINSINKWAYVWKKKNWKNGEVKNLELIQEAHALYDEIKHRVNIKWVKGHNGDKWNEYVDKLCQEVKIKNMDRGLQGVVNNKLLSYSNIPINYNRK